MEESKIQASIREFERAKGKFESAKKVLVDLKVSPHLNDGEKKKIDNLLDNVDASFNAIVPKLTQQNFGGYVYYTSIESLTTLVSQASGLISGLNKNITSGESVRLDEINAAIITIGQSVSKELPHKALSPVISNKIDETETQVGLGYVAAGTSGGLFLTGLLLTAFAGPVGAAFGIPLMVVSGVAAIVSAIYIGYQTRQLDLLNATAYIDEPPHDARPVIVASPATTSSNMQPAAKTELTPKKVVKLFEEKRQALRKVVKYMDDGQPKVEAEQMLDSLYIKISNPEISDAKFNALMGNEKTAESVAFLWEKIAAIDTKLEELNPPASTSGFVSGR